MKKRANIKYSIKEKGIYFERINSYSVEIFMFDIENV